MIQALPGVIVPMCIIVAVLVVLIVLIIAPKGKKRIEDALADIGLANSKGKTPILRYNKRDRKTKVVTMKFKPVNIPSKVWNDKRDAISEALDITIIGSISYGDKGMIIIKARRGYNSVHRGDLYDDEI